MLLRPAPPKTEPSTFDWAWDSFVIPLFPLALLFVARRLAGRHDWFEPWNVELPFTGLVTWTIVSRELLPLLDLTHSTASLVRKWVRGCELLTAVLLALYYLDTNHVWGMNLPESARNVVIPGVNFVLLGFGVILAGVARSLRKRYTA